MPTLGHLLSTRPDFDLDGLVQVANELLADLLPEATDARFQPEVNPRLVRHYTTQGLLEVPLRVGREARYTVDHLLQLLALRRLLAEGVQTGSIGTVLIEKDRKELLAIIEGRAKAEVEVAADPKARALGRIEAIRARMSEGASGMEAGAKSRYVQGFRMPGAQANVIGTSGKPAPETWERFTLLDGVELHVRSDVTVPTSPAEQRRLLDEITRLLILIAQRRLP